MNETNISVSSSPSKIPYGGFSPVRLQTGSPRKSSRERLSPHLYAALGRSSDPMAIAGMLTGRLSPPAPVQRPLARQRVILSRRVNAYYGLIRDSDLLPPIYALDGGSLCLTTDHRETRASPIYSACLYPRAVPPYPGGFARLLVIVTSSHMLAFAIFALARHPRTHKIRFIVACVTRLQVSLYATARRVCLPCPGQDFYFQAFIPRGHPPRTSNITTWAYNQFP